MWKGSLVGVETRKAVEDNAVVVRRSARKQRVRTRQSLMHLFFSPSVVFAEAIDIFGAEVPDAQDADERFEVDNVASLDDVFPGPASGFSRSGASTEATIIPRERPRRMADLFGVIMCEAATIKGIPMPAPPLASMSDDMQGECFRTLSSSRRITQCPLFPPVQHLFTAAALLCPGAGWRPSEKPLPPDRLQKQIAGLTDRVFVCASQSAAAVNNIALLSSALVSLLAGREAYGPEEAARWLAVSRFSSAILLLCQPVAVSAGRHMAWATMIQRAIWLSYTAVPERERASLVQGPLAPDGLFGHRFSEVLAHHQAARENRSRFGAILTGSSHQQAGRKRGPGRFQRSRGPPPPPTPMPQQQQQQPPPQPGRAAPRGQKFRKLAPNYFLF
ncbi:unnamed protein product [Boreogadus saida]